MCSVVVFVCFALCGINKTKKTTECHRCWPQSHQRRSAMHLQIWPLTVTPPLLHICMRQTSEIDHICRTVQYVWNGECALLCLAAVLLCSIFLRSYSVWVFFYCECLYRQIFPLFLHVNILLFLNALYLTVSWWVNAPKFHSDVCKLVYVLNDKKVAILFCEAFIKGYSRANCASL